MVNKLRRYKKALFDWWSVSVPSFAVQASILGTGTPAVGTTQAIAGIPAVTVEAGMGILIVVSNKSQAARVAPISGYKRLPYGECIAWTGSNATDAGPIRQTLFWKIAAGGESGNVTIDLTNNTASTATSIEATIYVIAKDPAAHLHIDVTGCHDNTPDTTYSGRSWRKLSSRVNDKYLTTNAMNTDLYTWSVQALSQPGITFTTNTQEIIEVGTNMGNDQEQFSSLFTVSSGEATDYLTVTATASGSAATNPIGIGHIIRIRQAREAQEIRSSGLQVFIPDDMIDATVDAEDGIGNGLRYDAEPSANYSLVSHNDKTHLSKDSDFRDDVNRRRQETLAVPEQPQHVENTITTWGQQFSLVNYVKPALQEIFTQAHTGSAPGAPSSNHPVIYFEILRDGQFAAPGGSLNIAYGMAAEDTGVENSIRMYSQPQINGSYIDMTGTHTHYFISEAKWAQSGGYLYVWYKNETMSDYVQILNATNIKTMATTAPELGDGTSSTGSNPLVSPHIKTGPYCHQSEDAADVAANKAVGHDRFNYLERAFKIVEQLPGEWDITDRAKVRADVDCGND